MKNLKDLFEHEIKDLYSAEEQLIEALPKMAEAATDKKLKQAFEKHLKETKDQYEKLKKVCDMCGIKPGGVKCVGMEGLIKEGQKMIKEKADADVKDAGLIAAAQRVEHYEIAGYGTARHFAKMIGQHKAAEILEDILHQEKKTDDTLNDLAIERVNKHAMASNKS